jgi:hypothetical protein
MTKGGFACDIGRASRTVWQGYRRPVVDGVRGSLLRLRQIGWSRVTRRVTIGAGIGVALALAGSRLIGSLLFGIALSDPRAIGSALAVPISLARRIPRRGACRLLAKVEIAT